MGAPWAERRETVEAILSRYPHKRSAVMPLLRLAQESRGYLEAEDLRAVGELVGLTLAEVESVASFYALFYRKPVGRFVLTVCGNLSCALAGARRLADHLSQRLGVRPGQTTADGLFTLQLTPECLAACDQAPVLQVNGYYLHRVSPERADRVLKALRDGVPIPELADRSELPQLEAAARGGD